MNWQKKKCLSAADQSNFFLYQQFIYIATAQSFLLVQGVMRHVATTSWFSSSPPLLKGGWRQLIPDFATTEREQIGCGILSLTENVF